jgi:hypothetical protein
MSRRSSYHGGSTIIRLTGSPDRAWAEEYAPYASKPDAKQLQLNNAQIEALIGSLNEKISSVQDKNFTKDAILQSAALVKRCDLPPQEDRVRSRLVTALIAAELTELYVKIVVGKKGQLKSDRIQRWTKLSEARAHVIWKQQFPEKT